MEDKNNNDRLVKDESNSVVSPARGRPRAFDIDSALKIAMKIFWEKGYAQTTMTDICQAIGIKPTSFYHAFGSKEELFLKTLNYYNEIYWNSISDNFMSESDIREAVKKLFRSAVQVYMRPGLPKGCFIDISTTGLPEDETRIHEALSEIQNYAKNNIRKRLLMAIDAGQLRPDCDIPVITNAIYTFLKGISSMARENVCQAELNHVASLGASLLPPAS